MVHQASCIQRATWGAIEVSADERAGKMANVAKKVMSVATPARPARTRGGMAVRDETRCRGVSAGGVDDPTEAGSNTNGSRVL